MYPCNGLRVLDMSRVVAGPIAGRILSDLGADVVKLEPPEGDVTRVWGHVRHGLSGFYTQQNAGKRNVCIDLRVDGAADVVRALAAQADIVIENFRAGVLDRLGLGYEDLRAVNHDLIMLSVSGFGHGGPESPRPAYAPRLQADAGPVHRAAHAAHPARTAPRSPAWRGSTASPAAPASSGPPSGSSPRRFRIARYGSSTSPPARATCSWHSFNWPRRRR